MPYTKRKTIRRFSHVNTTAIGDPYRRLLNAILIRALRDYLDPTGHLSNYDRETASAFVWSETGRELLAWSLGVSQPSAQRHLIRLAEERKCRIK